MRVAGAARRPACPVAAAARRPQRRVPALALLLLAAAALALAPAPAGAQADDQLAALNALPAADPAALQRANDQLAALNALPAAPVTPPAAAPVPAPERITIEEQLQQAEALGVKLTQEQLARANPLLGTAGRLKDPERRSPADWPDGWVAERRRATAAAPAGPERSRRSHLVGARAFASGACMQWVLRQAAGSHLHLDALAPPPRPPPYPPATLQSARSSRTSTAPTCASGSSTTGT